MTLLFGDHLEDVLLWKVKNRQGINTQCSAAGGSKQRAKRAPYWKPIWTWGCFIVRGCLTIIKHGSLRNAEKEYQIEVIIKQECGLSWLSFTPTVFCLVTWLFLVWLEAGTGSHSSPLFSPSGTTVHTQLDDAYLCQEQLALNEITLSLTNKGQDDHSLAKTLPLPSHPSVRAAPSLLPALLFMLSDVVCFLLTPPWLPDSSLTNFSSVLFLAHFQQEYHLLILSVFNVSWPCPKPTK